MNESRTIIYDESKDPYKPKVEFIKPNIHSIFQDVYMQAFEEMDSILYRQENIKDDSQYGKYDYQNIIAFAGDRGTGKTSAMMSMAKTLKSPESLSGIHYFKHKENKFLVLDPICPAQISDNETVIDVFLAQLYNDFEKRMRLHSESIHSSIEEKRRLYSCFEKVHEIIQKQCMARKDLYGEADLFQNKAAGSKLKTYIEELINYYLEISNHDFMVLQVDDIDLNLVNVYQICEDIRKYLNAPKVVVLFAVNTDQLSTLIQQQYYKEMKPFHDMGDKEYIKETVPQMAEQYLIKLIPTARRCYLPELNMSACKELKLIIKDSKCDGKSDTEENLVEAVLRLIHEKCGLILVAEQGEHALVPDTLRKLQHFLTILIKMESVSLYTHENNQKDRKKDYTLLSKNLTKLEQYCHDEVVPSLHGDERKLFDLFDEVPNIKMNKVIVRYIYSLASADQKGAISGDQTRINKIGELARISVMENVTAGDIFSALNEYSMIALNSKKFIALVKLFYSIRAIRTRFIDFEDGNRELYILLGGSIVSFRDLETYAVNHYMFTNLKLIEFKISDEFEKTLLELFNENSLVYNVACSIYDNTVNGKYMDSVFACKKLSFKDKNTNLQAELDKWWLNKHEKNLLADVVKQMEEPYYKDRFSGEAGLFGNNTYKYFSVFLPSALCGRLLSESKWYDLLPMHDMDVLYVCSRNLWKTLKRKDKYSHATKDSTEAFNIALKTTLKDCEIADEIKESFLEAFEDEQWKKELNLVRFLDAWKDKKNAEEPKAPKELSATLIKNTIKKYKEKINQIDKVIANIGKGNTTVEISQCVQLITEIKNMRISPIKGQLSNSLKSEVHSIITRWYKEIRQKSEHIETEDVNVYKNQIIDIKSTLSDAINALEEFQSQRLGDNESISNEE